MVELESYARVRSQLLDALTDVHRPFGDIVKEIDEPMVDVRNALLLMQEAGEAELLYGFGWKRTTPRTERQWMGRPVKTAQQWADEVVPRVVAGLDLGDDIDPTVENLVDSFKSGWSDATTAQSLLEWVARETAGQVFDHCVDATTLEGETRMPDEGVMILDAGEFAARWNAAPPRVREQIWRSIREASDQSFRCKVVDDHEGAAFVFNQRIADLSNRLRGMQELERHTEVVAAYLPAMQDGSNASVEYWLAAVEGAVQNLRRATKPAGVTKQALRASIDDLLSIYLGTDE